MAEILTLKNVSKVFGSRKGLFGQKRPLLAVDDVSFSVEPGESLGLVGESGCGKSTLGKLACGLLLPDYGKIEFYGRDLPRAGASSWAAGKIQMVFQDPVSSLNPRLKIAASVAEPLERGKEGRRERKRKALEMLEAVGLEGMGERYPHLLSGGQRQRVALARALVTHPDAIVCDEPVSALDASVQAQVLNLLKEMRERFQPAMLFISHDLAVIGFMCRRIMVMYLGQIVEKAPRERLFASPGHPYTQALMAAMPSGEGEWAFGKGLEKLPPAMPGEPPSPLNPPSGCRFHPRCRKARDICALKAPPWQELGPEWQVRCFFPGA